MIADLPYARSRACLPAVPLITAVARTTAVARITAVAIVTMVQGLAAAGKVGLVVAGEGLAGPVVSALRPNAMVLVVLNSGRDVPEILTALRI